MKLIKITTLFSALILVFSSCSDNDDDNNKKQDCIKNYTLGTKAVFNTNLIKKFDGATFAYNTDNLLVKITGEDISYTFDYKTSTCSDTVFINIIDGDEDQRTIAYVIGKNGFADKAITKYKEYDGGTLDYEGEFEYLFEYNTDNQLSKMSIIEKDEPEDYIYTLDYTNGNLTKISHLVEGDTSVTNYQYSSELYTGIENKAGVMFFDLVYDMDFDTFDLAYYAGLLGKPTKQLPLRALHLEKDDPTEINHTIVFDWSLDNSGYPASLSQTYESNTYTFEY